MGARTQNPLNKGPHLAIRVIPRLDIKGPNLVKGMHLEGLRVLGKPEAFARFYYEQGADELFYQDMVASLYGRNSLEHIVEKTASEIFIPLTVGGGLRTVEDMRRILKVGADKIAINTAAINRPELIKEAAHTFGSSTIVVVIEAIRQPDGLYHCYTDCGREATGVEAVGWAVRAAELGAGEILITSVDREGTGAGFDLDLIRSIASEVDIPVIAHGGAGSAEDVSGLLQSKMVDAVAIASMFHYGCYKNFTYEDDSFVREGNTAFMTAVEGVGRKASIAISELKQCLCRCGIECRID